jgi:cytochrome P450
MRQQIVAHLRESSILIQKIDLLDVQTESLYRAATGGHCRVEAAPVRSRHAKGEAMSERDTRQVIEFDHHTSDFAANTYETLAETRGKCPLGFSEAHGGFWTVFRHATGMSVFRDHKHFATSKFVDEEGVLRGGLTVPTIESLDLIPGEIDPPEWNEYRRLLNPVFSPDAVDRLRPRIRELADDLIDQFIERGEADLVEDLANLLPASVTIDFLGLDHGDLQLFSDPFHKATWAPAGSPEWLEAVEGFRKIPEVLMRAVEDRRSKPRGDYISKLVEMRIDDRLLTDDELIKILVQLLAGGIDSTAALLSCVFMYLEDHPEARRPLLDDPKLLQRATEEFVRYFTPIQAIARSATEDVVLEGEQIARREPVLIFMASMNRDERVFENPDAVVLDRWPNRHVGFGLGMHRCLGSNLARAMFQTTLLQVLSRLGDFRVEGAVPYGVRSTINGWITIPATFTPGPRVKPAS